ncbi:MAG: hypothetical protein IT195_14330 [Microthrixaceae bacterium]|nr:hypothetical protein [Microthrixaceae bacterium]
MGALQACALGHGYIIAMQASLPEPLLACWNARWATRLALLQQRVPPPAWQPGLAVVPARREAFEQYLPLHEWLRDMRCLALRCLPSPAWLPAPLAAVRGRDLHAPATDGLPYAALPDLWNALPPRFAGRVTFSEAEFLPLLCALADPPRFGTDFGRYPEQLTWLREHAARHRAPAPLRLVDLGCGTGQGTWEAAAVVAAAADTTVVASGLTREPLEAWMAAQRCLPHDPERSARYRDWPGANDRRLHVQFAVGDAGAVPLAAGADVLLANGLVGGAFLNRPAAFRSFLAEVQRLAAPDAVLLCANRFHDGRRAALDMFCACARDCGWRVAGSPGSLVLRTTAHGG